MKTGPCCCALVHEISAKEQLYMTIWPGSYIGKQNSVWQLPIASIHNEYHCKKN